MSQVEHAQFAMLREATRAVADRYSVESADAIDPDLRVRTADALAGLGLDEMRTTEEDGASIQECVALVEELGARLLCGPYLGPLFIGTELLRLLGMNGSADAPKRTVAVGPNLGFCGRGALPGELVAWDAGDAASALLVTGDGRVLEIPVGETLDGNDLLRPLRSARWESGSETIGQLDPAQLSSWRAFTLAMLAGEMVGCSRRVVDMAVEYAHVRTQYGRPIGTFQSIAHLLAEAYVAVESAQSITRYAAWCCDTEGAATAIRSAQIAKAYVGQAASDAVQIAMQVFGGIAHTWDHVAHLHLRRVLADGITFAATDDLLDELAGWEQCYA